MRKRKILISVLCIIFNISMIFSSTPPSFATTDLPVGHWVYKALEDMAMMGMTDIAGLSTRPISRMAAAGKVAGMIEKIQKEELPFSALQDEAAMRKAEAILYKLMDEFENELMRLGVEVVKKDETLQKDILYKLFDDVKARIIYGRFEHASVKSIKQENRRGWKLYEDFNGRASFRSYASYQDSVGLSLEPAFYGAKDRNYVTLDEAFLKAAYSNVEFGAGRTSLWWGPGRHGSLLLSSNTRPLYLANVGSQRPFRIPYLEKLGLWNVNFFTSKLIGEENRNIKEPYLSGLKIDYSPHKRLNFGIAHTIMWGGEGVQHVSVVDLADMFFSKMGGGENEADNHLISFTGEWAVPYVNRFLPVANGALLYGELGAEDEENRLPHRIAGLGGIRIIDLLMIDDLDLIMEYARTGGIWYTHGTYKNGYTSRGNILGHHVGTEGDDFFVAVAKKFGEQLELEARFDAERHRYNSPTPEKKYEGGINFKVFWTENISIEADYEFEYWGDFNNVANRTNKNHVVSICASLKF